MRFVAILSAAAAASLPALAASVERISVDPKTGYFVDSLGRVRIFHGVNAVFKEWPWLPRTDTFHVNDSLADPDMDLLRDWGFNVVRLGVMWPGVEPAPGQIDQGYLDQASDLASRLAERGVYTLVDFHQDLGSRHFCGEGVPEHYVDALLGDPSSRLSQASPFPQPIHGSLALNASGYPSLEDCLRTSFALYYVSERVGALFRELYTAGTPLNDGVQAYWEAVARAFAGQPHVVGYELLNEPAAFCLDGDLTSCLTAGPFLGSGFEDKVLAPFYRALAKRIRAVDATTPIFVEPSPYPKVTGHLPFTEAPLGADPQQVLAYHIYCAPGDGNGKVQDLLCKAVQDIDEQVFMGFLGRFKGLGGFMTEFGAVGQSEGELEHMQRLLALADSAFQSWAYWQLKLYRDLTTQNSAEPLYDGQGSLEVEKLRTLSRTYAQAIAGTPVRMSFSPADATFELEYQASAAQGPTEIYANKALHYPHGYSVEVSPAGCLETSWADNNHLIVSETGACSDSYRKVRVTQLPASVKEVATFV